MRRRYGTARTPRAVSGHVHGHQCHSLTPMFVNALGGPEAACRRYCQVTLELEPGAYSGIASWRGAQHWVEIVVRCAYTAEYNRIRPELVKTSKTGSVAGGGISLKSLLAVAKVMAGAADFDSGRSSRLSIATLVERTGSESGPFSEPVKRSNYFG